MRPVAICLFLWAGAVLSACHSKTPPAQLFGPVRTLEPGDYPEVLSTWTRRSEIYQALDQKMFIDATLHSPEFRKSFALAWPDVYGAGGQVTRRELVELSGEAETTHTFFLSVYTADREWNDLSDDSSIWRLTLSSADIAVEAQEIISVPVDANLRAVYPHIDRFDECYLVRFPLSDPMGRLVLSPSQAEVTVTIASALGRAELKWQLVPYRGAETAPGESTALQVLE